MRVIAGEFRGRNLNFVSTEILRPTADVVKEALFTKLSFFFPINNFLDLFSGTGGIGIEALSRGAKKVFFVEKNRNHANIIENNLKALKIDYDKNNLNSTKRAVLFVGDYETFLQSIDEKFDIIFIDPPYKSDFYDLSLNIIKERNILADDGLIVLEHDRDKKFTEETFEVVSQKKYGKRCLTYLSKK